MMKCLGQPYTVAIEAACAEVRGPLSELLVVYFPLELIAMNGKISSKVHISEQT